MNDKITPKTPSERQTKRQNKLKTAFYRLSILESDLVTATVIINATIDSLILISEGNPDKKALTVAWHQLQNALRYIRTDDDKGDLKRRSSDKHNLLTNVKNCVNGKNEAQD